MQQLTRVFIAETRDAEDGMLAASLASDQPVRRDFGTEVLDFGPGAVDLSRAKDGLPLLSNHETQTLIGRVHGVRVEGNKLRGHIKFFDTQAGRDARATVRGGHREVSIGYQIHDMQRDGKVHRVTRWTPYEASIVSIPADPTVGINRAMPEGRNTMNTTTQTGGTADDDTDTGAALSRSQRRLAAQSGDLERARTRSLSDIASGYSQWVTADMLAGALREGTSSEQFQRQVLERMQSGATDVRFGATPYLTAAGDPPNRFAQFNLGRALLAEIDPSAYLRTAGMEKEISQEMRRNSPLPTTGILVPLEAFFAPPAGRRDMTAGTYGNGGSTVQTNVDGSQWIDVIRQRSIAVGMGATVLPGLQAPTILPRKVATTTAAWVTEVGPLSESDVTTSGLSLTPKRIGAYVEPSRQLMLTSSIGIEAMLRDDLQQTLIAELDRVSVNGTGTGNQPTGIRLTAGIGSVVGGTNGATLIWQHILDLEAAVDGNNGVVNPQTVGYAINGPTRSYLKRTPRHATLAEGLIMGDTPNDQNGYNVLNGYRAAISAKVLSNLVKGTSGAVCSSLVFGDWSQLIVALFGGGVEIIVDPYTLAITGQLRITANLFADVGVRQALSFATMDDAKLS